MPRKKNSYGESVKQLEEILQELNSNDVDIDQLHGKVKKARELLEMCKKKLKSTEEEIDELLS